MVLAVQKEHGSYLKTSAERVKNAGRDVSLGISPLRCFCSIYCQLQCWIVKRLLDTNIHKARNMSQIGKNLVGIHLTRVDVVAFQLNINRGGDAEVENLSCDI